MADDSTISASCDQQSEIPGKSGWKRALPERRTRETSKKKHHPRRKITDVEQIGAGLKRNDVEGLHMETDATVDNSITSSSRVNERLTTPFHSSVHFDSPELPCAGILLSST